jgi:hypothetical protein
VLYGPACYRYSCEGLNPWISASAGLRTHLLLRFRTCVSIMVVRTLVWPNSSCTVRMSEPSSSRCGREKRGRS